MKSAGQSRCPNSSVPSHLFSPFFRAHCFGRATRDRWNTDSVHGAVALQTCKFGSVAFISSCLHLAEARKNSLEKGPNRSGFLQMCWSSRQSTAGDGSRMFLIGCSILTMTDLWSKFDPSPCALLQDIAIIKIEQCCFAMLKSHAQSTGSTLPAMPACATDFNFTNRVSQIEIGWLKKDQLSNHYPKQIRWLEFYWLLTLKSIIFR